MNAHTTISAGVQRGYKRKEPEALGNGWFLYRYDMRTWTEYEIYEKGADGMVANGHVARFCRKRDALAYMAKARAELARVKP